MNSSRARPTSGRSHTRTRNAQLQIGRSVPVWDVGQRTLHLQQIQPTMSNMPRGRRLTGADEVVASPDAREAARRLAALEGTLVAVDAAGTRVDLPEDLTRLLRRAGQEIATGHNITMLRSDEVLTPNEAAEVLGVSRQYLTRLLDKGVIPSETLPDSTHRRLLLADVLAFQAERERRREGVAAFRRAVGDAALADD
jgi:excisionase family DNA binding protein